MAKERAGPDSVDGISTEVGVRSRDWACIHLHGLDARVA